VDCAGPWTVQVKNSITLETNKYTIKVLTIVEQCTSWLEIGSLINSSAKVAALALDRQYFCQY